MSASQPMRSFTVTGTSAGAASRTARAMAPASGGSFSSALPAPGPAIFGAGQPMLMSIKSKGILPRISQIRRAASAITSGCAPNSCTPKGASPPPPAISRGLFLSPIVKAFALTISLTVHTAPWAAHRRRIVVSVAPAIGAKDAPFARVNRPNCIDQPTFLYLEKRSAGRRRPSGTSERYLCYCTIKFHIMVYYTGTFHI